VSERDGIYREIDQERKTQDDLFRYRRQLVRLASTAVAALESLDRQTVVGPGPEQRGKGF
jgi:hypothetical protein